MMGSAQLCILLLAIRIRTGLTFLFSNNIPLPFTISKDLALKPLLSSASSTSSSLSTKTAPIENPWKTSLSQHPDALTSLGEVIDDQIKDPPDIAFLFVSQYHASSFSQLVEEASQILGPNTRLLSLLGGGVIGAGNEVDDPTSPSISLMSGFLPPGATATLFSFNELNDPPPAPESSFWSQLGACDDNFNYSRGGEEHSSRIQRPPSFILFADPWAPIGTIIEGLDKARHDGPPPVVVGGISCPKNTKPTVGIGGRPLPQGSVVGVAFSGTLGLQAVVAQGCRPVGPPFEITEHYRLPSGRAVSGLDGKKALDQLQDVTSALSKEDKKYDGAGYNSYLLCGISRRFASAGAYDERDYLVRQIVGFQPRKGAVILSSVDFETGDLLRFHVRDRDTAKEDLELGVRKYFTERVFHGASGGDYGEDVIGTPVAVMQISCMARGRELFGEANCDLEGMQQLLPLSNVHEGENEEEMAPPIAGFFANGEIGPVGVAGFDRSIITMEENGKRTYIHGFTCVAAVFCTFHESALPTSNTIEMKSEKASDENHPTAWG